MKNKPKYQMNQNLNRKKHPNLLYQKIKKKRLKAHQPLKPHRPKEIKVALIFKQTSYYESLQVNPKMRLGSPYDCESMETVDDRLVLL